MSLDCFLDLIKRRDAFSKHLGIEILEVREGYCRAAMVVKKEHLNFHGFVHGGAVFSLADTAFAAASNARNKTALALSVSVNYRRPVKEGERLLAEAVEESLGKSTGLYRMTVSTADNKLVAVCQGLVYILDQPVIS